MRFPMPRIRQLLRFVQQQPKVFPATSLSRVILAAFLLAVAATSGGYLVVNRINQLPTDAVFRIDDTVFTKQQLQRRVQVLKGLYGIQRPKSPARLNQFNRDTAKAIAVSEILGTVARTKGITIADKTAYDQLGKLIKENYQNDRSSFVKELGANGISQREVLNELKRQLTYTELFALVSKEIRPATEKDARGYYDQNRNKMVSPEQREIRNIVVAAERKATRIASQARSGVDFATLAQQHSMDAQTRKDGGYLGAVSADQLDPKYATEAFAAKTDDIFGPVKTAHGWNIGQVTKIHEAVPLPFGQLKDALQNKLTNEARFNAWNRWLGQQIKAANVEYAPAYRPANPNSPPTQIPRQ